MSSRAMQISDERVSNVSEVAAAAQKRLREAEAEANSRKVNVGKHLAVIQGGFFAARTQEEEHQVLTNAAKKLYELCGVDAHEDQDVLDKLRWAYGQIMNAKTNAHKFGVMKTLLHSGWKFAPEDEQRCDLLSMAGCTEDDVPQQWIEKFKQFLARHCIIEDDAGLWCKDLRPEDVAALREISPKHNRYFPHGVRASDVGDDEWMVQANRSFGPELECNFKDVCGKNPTIADIEDAMKRIARRCGLPENEVNQQTVQFRLYIVFACTTIREFSTGEGKYVVARLNADESHFSSAVADLVSHYGKSTVLSNALHDDKGLQYCVSDPDSQKTNKIVFKNCKFSVNATTSNLRKSPGPPDKFFRLGVTLDPTCILGPGTLVYLSHAFSVFARVTGAEPCS